MDQGQVSSASQHEDDKGHQVQASESLGQALIVTGEPSTTSHPGEAALDDPPTRQQDEAALCLRQLDHLQSDAMRGGGFGRALTCIALIDVSQSDACQVATLPLR